MDLNAPHGTLTPTNSTLKWIVASAHENLTRCVSVACQWAAHTMEKFDIPVPQVIKTFVSL